MSADATLVADDPEEEIAALVRVLHETQQRLQDLAGGELDAVVIPGGQSYLLHDAQEKLRQSEATQRDVAARQASILDALPAHIALVDPEGVILSVNEGWRQFAAGDGVENFPAGTDWNYLEVCARPHGPYAAEALEAVAGVRRVMAGESRQFALEYHCPSTVGPRWFQLIVSPIQQTGACGAVVKHVDITARKLAEKALRESEESFRRISAELTKVLDSSLDVICTFDADGRFTQVSAACERVWGYKSEELLGTHFLDLVHPDDAAETHAADTRIRAGSSARGFENRYVRKDGVVVHLMWSAWWSEADQSNFCVAHDVTETHLANVRARELTERLKLAVTASKVGIWDLDLVTGAMLWDEQMYALHGAAGETLPAGLELWRRHLHPDDFARAYAEFEEALLPDGRPFDTVFRIVLPATGETRHIRALGRTFRDADGRPVRMLGTNWDVTEQVERENMLRQNLENERSLRRQALAGEKAKSEFLAVMSHEIRTPMNGMLGFAEMLARSPDLSPEGRDLSQTIVSSGEALLRIIDDILDFSRIEAGHLTIENRAFSPAELVRDIEMLFARQGRAKGLDFLVSVEKGLAESLPGDAGRLRQILVNLVGNALKFTERGSIEVGVRSVFEVGAPDRLEFVVRDTGMGVAADHLQTIFHAFTQEDSSTTRRHGGTGLGLTISRRLAELLGGTLRLDSRVGEGSTFTLLVPILVAGPKKDSRRPERLADDRPLNATFALRHPLRILVAEDDGVNLKLVVRMLGQLGFQALAAHDGLEACAIYGAEPIDCVLMDMQMPGMDGIEATRRIRELEHARGLRPASISALTANILPEDRQRCVDAGMDFYLNKPVKLRAIADVLVEAWKLHRAPDGGNLRDA